MSLTNRFRLLPARMILSLLLLPLGIGLAGGCASDKQIIAQAADAHRDIEPAVINDGALDAYVQAIGDRIVETAREMEAEGRGPRSQRGKDNEWMFQDIRFHLVNAPTLNAFTTGGQHVYLYSELFTSSKTEDEFAAVVAHEFGHIYGRHVQKGTNRQYASLGVAAAAAVGGAVLAGEDNRMAGAAIGGGAGLVAAQFVNMGFTRDDENDADDIGFEIYCRAGWDPERFPDFFKQMIDKGYDTTPEMMSDHPSLKNRVKATEERIDDLPASAREWRRPNIVDARKLQEYQDRARRLAKTMPRDRSLEAAQLMLMAFPSCVSPVEQPSQRNARHRLAEAAESGEPPRRRR